MVNEPAPADKPQYCVNFARRPLNMEKMKKKIWIGVLCVSLLGFIHTAKKPGVEPEPWTAAQLMAPADLAAVLANPQAKKPVIYSVGPGALIRNSIDMGPAHEKENLDKLRLALSKLPKDEDIVIYCGCCPFDRCPNIRPAFSLLNEMKFTQAHLLNLEHNIRTDWVAKGYPSVQ
jgi:thiosulfate/3-mercaptopyruvate sulfurtransferase